MSLQKIDIFGIFRIKNGRQSAIFRVIKSKIEPIRAIMILNHPTKGKVKRFDKNQVIIRKRKTDGQTDGQGDYYRATRRRRGPKYETSKIIIT